MSGGAQQQPQQTTQAVLSPEQQRLMQIAMPGVEAYAANVPQRYQGQTVAGFTDPQTAGQQQILGSSPGQQGVVQSAADANQFYTSGNIWDPSVNPNLRGAIDAAIRPVQQNLTEKELPQIRDAATMAGGFGGSRQGIAEGLATGRANMNELDAASKIAQSQYQTNVDAQGKAIAGANQVAQGLTIPGATTSAVGDVQQAQQQAQLNSLLSNWNYDQMAPFLQSQQIMSLMAGLPGGSTTSTANTPQANPWMQSLGGAASGAALGSMIMPGIGTGLGAVAGGVAPWLLR